ncbi:acyl-CoA dehydrogenase C-terminal domain-containing protein [Caballeronia sp. LZ019]|nr:MULTISPECIES: acyl-CoA dehydrogenase C-terminal domain-containing protein [unclassified Caballeronia]MDR5740528.1 acyl-CoA dehydrogenase C-terminal domain-containing protein [Caballeronia sp. LZ016]MDR5808951.1 acyl-CoA dehydrogenase C-terminal domain-containing protein [Caballeronia sp. LZ019]
MHDGAALRLLEDAMRATALRAQDGATPNLQRHAHELTQSASRLTSVTKRMWAAADASVTLANASLYLEAFGHVVMAWVWLEQAIAARQALPGAVAAERMDDEAFYRGKLAAAGYFFRWELPRVSAQLDFLASLDRTLLDMQDAWF